MQVLVLGDARFARAVIYTSMLLIDDNPSSDPHHSQSKPAVQGLCPATPLLALLRASAIGHLRLLRYWPTVASRYMHTIPPTSAHMFQARQSRPCSALRHRPCSCLFSSRSSCHSLPLVPPSHPSSSAPVAQRPIHRASPPHCIPSTFQLPQRLDTPNPALCFPARFTQRARPVSRP